MLLRLMAMVVILASASNAPGADARVNLFPNSSFNKQSNPGYPDWWSADRTPEWRSDWPACWRIVEERRVEGAQSLRMEKLRADCPLDAVVLRSSSVPVAAGEDYTLSFWARAEKEGQTVRVLVVYLWGGVFLDKRVKIEKEWTRHVLSAKTEKGKRRLTFYWRWEGDGFVLINAPQFERGNCATPYRAEKGPAPAPVTEPTAVATAETTCPVVSEPPVIDGRLDDACWNGTAKLTNFVLYNGPAPAREKTVCRVLRDSRSIYIAFDCLDSEPERITARVTRRDDVSIFADDELEVFISSNRLGVPYYQVAVNPLGTVFDALGKDPAWNMTLRVKARRTATGWSAELAIPFANFRFPRDDSGVWRLNLCRHRANSTNEEYSSWSPVLGAFHAPDRFGVLRGIAGEDLAKYSVSAELKVVPAGAGDDAPIKILLEASAKPWQNGKRVLLARCGLYTPKSRWFSRGTRPLGPGESEAIQLLPQLTRRQNAAVIWELRDPSTNELLQYGSLGMPQRLAWEDKPVLKLLASRSFYRAGEPVALRVRVETDESARSKAELRLVVDNGDSGDVERIFAAPLEKEIIASFGRARAPGGKAVATLLDGRGKVVASDAVLFDTLEPKPTDVQIDRFANMFRVGGKPFVPFAVCMDDWSRRVPKDPEYVFRDVAPGRFNTVMYFYSPASYPKAQRFILETGAKLGFRVLLAPGGLQGPYADYKKRCLAIVKQVKDHPNLLGYVLCDEPGGWWVRKVGPSRDLLDLKRSIAAIDKRHPAMVLYCGAWRPTYAKVGTLECTDAYHMNRYPFSPGQRAPMRNMEDLVREMFPDADRDGKPVSLCLQMSANFDVKREPTPAEQINQTYLTLIAGARVFSYFVAKPMCPELWDTMKKLNREMEALADVLAGKRITALVDCSEPAVRFAAFETARGRYVIAANAAPQKVRATFKLARPAKNVSVRFESRSIAPEGERFSDVFDGYARHVYEIAE